jgi:replicative DNA helicase
MDYSVELYLLKLFLDPVFHKKYHSFVQSKFVSDNSQILGQLFESVGEFHKNFPDKQLETSDLQVWYLSLFPSISPQDRSLLAKLCENLASVEAKPELAEKYIQSHIDRVRATEIVAHALKVSEGKGDFSGLVDRIKANQDNAVAVTEQYVSDELDSLIEAQVSTPGLRFRLKTLRRMLGSLRKGDFGFIFKRPETGGTTLLASEVTFMAEQVQNPILWINNEEQDQKVLLRCYCAYFGITLDELARGRKKYAELYRNNIGGRILLPDPTAFHRRDVERLCAAIRPSLVVIDQLDKVKGFNEDRDDLELTAKYQWARELSKEYAPLIGVCQAGVTAEGKKYLTMDDVNGSKTGKQGEADWILGVGKTHQPGLENVRHFHVVKNKLVGDSDSDPAWRHGKADVLIAPTIARYSDIGEGHQISE